jgi:hypothetical protein
MLWCCDVLLLIVVLPQFLCWDVAALQEGGQLRQLCWHVARLSVRPTAVACSLLLIVLAAVPVL